MPLGRPGLSGGFAWVSPLPNAVNVRSMERWIKRGKPPPKLTAAGSRKLNLRLRKLISIYRIACATPQPTATERRRILGKIKNAARRFVETPKKLWADKLLDCLDAADVNTRSILNHAITAQGYSPTGLIAMKRDLRNLFFRSIYPDESLPTAHTPSIAERDRSIAFDTHRLPMVRGLANIDVDVLVRHNERGAKGRRKSGRWRDPPLANLVAGLEPIWRRMTGRSAKPTSKDREGDNKECKFADWLMELLEKVELPRPPVGRIVDIVRCL